MDNAELNKVFDKVIKGLSKTLVTIKSNHANSLLCEHVENHGVDSVFIDDGLRMVRGYDDVYHIEQLINEVINIKAKEYFKYMNSLTVSKEE